MTYKKGDYQKYHASPKKKKARAARNKERREAEREGRVHKGDGKVVDHKDVKAKPGGATAEEIFGSATQVISKGANTAKSNRQRARKKK